MSNQQPFFMASNTSISLASATDELLHPDQNRLITADSCTETQYLGFQVPEAKIHAYAYLWHHPNLGVVTGGLLCWKGEKETHHAAELCDIRTYLSDKCLPDDLNRFRLDNSYGIEVIEPLKRLRMTYDDPARGNHVDLLFDAVGPAVMFGDRTHFEQPMRVSGKLILRGEHFNVNCFTVRDRSWGKPRPETNMPLPPYSWMSGAFDESLSFNCGRFDDLTGNPEVKGRFELPDNRLLAGGWLYKDGQMARVVSSRKRVERGHLQSPQSIELELVDDRDRQVAIRGSRIAHCSWTPWSNMRLGITLMRWECEGRVAYGDCQEGMWPDYCHSLF